MASDSAAPTAHMAPLARDGTASTATHARALTAAVVPDGNDSAPSKVRPTAGFRIQSDAATAAAGPTSKAVARARLRRKVMRKAAPAPAMITTGEPSRVTVTSAPRWWRSGSRARAQVSKSVGPGRIMT